jgi:Flp pilus assembly protein CpaB
LLHTATDSVTSTSVGGDLGSPRAARLARPRWLDPRLVAGLLLVLGSVVLGARIVAAADDTVPVLVAAADLAPGQRLTEAMVETRQVVLDGNADLYHTGDVGAGYVVVSPVREGELLARSAVAASADAPAIRYVTVAVPAPEAPAGLVAGDAVDVWRTQAEQGEEPAASPVLADVTVTAVDAGGSGLTGPGSQVRVTLAVTGGSDLDESVAALVGAARDGRVYLAQVPEASR